MKKCHVCLTLGLLSFSHLGEAQSLGQFYAKLNVNGQLADEGAGNFTEIRSNNSWIGVKGDIPLEQGMAVV